MKFLDFCLITIIYAAWHKNGLVEGYRILGLFPLHGKSHFVMSEQLMKGLARKGHQVDVIGHFPLKKPVPNYNDLSIEGSVPKIVNNMTYESFQKFTSFEAKRFMEAIGDPVCELMGHPVLQNLIKNPSNPPYDAIIVEIFASNCYLAFGKHLKTPMIGLVTAAWYDWLTMPLAHPHLAAITNHAFAKSTQSMNFWGRLESFWVTYMINFEFHGYLEKQLSYVQKYIGQQYDNIYDLHKNLSLVLINSHHSINGIKSFSPGIVEVGGLHVQDEGTPLPAEVDKWLDGANQGCVYMSFGSMVKIESFPKNTLDVFYKTIKKLAPVRFLIKIAKKDELPPGLPNNAMTYHWLPQITVLKHKNVKAFVTHGGLMGTLESIIHAVPMVGFPLFGDQATNLDKYVTRKLAIALDHQTVTTESFVNALNTVLKDPEYRENIKKVSALYLDRPMSPLDTAVYWIEYVIRHGNVLQSPGMYMPWWKFALLDVYAFLTTILIIALIILRFIIKLIVKIFKGKRKATIAKKKN